MPVKPTSVPRTAPQFKTVVTLDQMTLENFKNDRSFILQPKGKNLSLLADNGVGKTTKFDAWNWVWTGKDSLGRSDDEQYKTIDPVTKEPFHNLNHTAELCLRVNGEPLVVTCTYREKWEKQRGSITETFTGHTTDYFIDKVGKAKKDYAAVLAGICDPKLFPLLSDANYFNGRMSWQDRRKLLLEVCGDISDADVIASNDKLSKLPAILGKYSTDDYRTILTAGRKKINDELKTVPARIDEVRRGLPENVSEGDFVPVIAKHRREIEALNERKVQAKAGGEIVAKQIRIREIDGEIKAVGDRIRAAAGTGRTEALNEIRFLESQIKDAKQSVQLAEGRQGTLTREKANCEADIARLREQGNAELAKGFTGDSICPACNQPLPEDRVAEAKAAFNLQRSQKLEQINRDGVAKSERVRKINAELAEIETEISEAKRAVEGLSAQLVNVEVPSVEVDEYDIESQCATLIDERVTLTEAIAEERAGSTAAIEAIDDEIQAIQSKINAAEALAATQRQKADAEARLKELDARQKELGAAFEKSEQELWLIDEFERTKVAMLTGKINAKFSYVQFKLFDVQVNGGLAPTCVTTVNGVPWDAGLNTGARINAGLDIIRTLQAHYGISLPVFVDGAESVTKLLPMDCQVIRLVVSEADKKLRVVIDSTTEPQGTLI